MFNTLPTHKKIFSVVLSVFIVAGISMSTIHYHGDAHADYVETEHQLSNDHYHCLICGSVFQTDTDSQNSFFVHFAQTNILSFEPPSVHLPIFVDGFNGRAPPLV